MPNKELTIKEFARRLEKARKTLNNVDRYSLNFKKRQNIKPVKIERI